MAASRRRYTPAAPRSSSATLCVLLLVAVLTACTGSEDPGDEPPVGAVATNETVTASNLAIVSDEEGNAVLVGTIINQGPDEQLGGVEIQDGSGDPVPVRLVDGPVSLPSEEPVRLAEPAMVLVASEQLRRGFRAPLTLTFASSDPIRTTVTVETHDDPYDKIPIPEFSATS